MGLTSSEDHPTMLKVHSKTFDSVDTMRTVVIASVFKRLLCPLCPSLQRKEDKPRYDEI